MRYCSDGVIRPAKFVFASLILAAALTWFAVPVQAADTQVRVNVCHTNDAGSATIGITSPIGSPVVLDSSTVTVAGQVTSATQIDVSINGDYAMTVPLSSGQTTFSFDVSVYAGNSTIELEAISICEPTSATDSLTVSYQPPRPTPIPDPMPDPQGRVPEVASPAAIRDTGPDSIDDLSKKHGFIGRIATALDLDVMLARDGLWKTMLRFMLIVLGIAMMIFGPRAYSWVVDRYDPNILPPSHVMIDVMLRLGGLAMLVIGLAI